MWIYVLILWLSCGGVSAYIASQKNRSTLNWLLLGLIFGIFALIAIAAVPSLTISKQEQQVYKPSSLFNDINNPMVMGSVTKWDCPHCHHTNYLSSSVCSRCDHKVDAGN